MRSSKVIRRRAHVNLVGAVDNVQTDRDRMGAAGAIETRPPSKWNHPFAEIGEREDARGTPELVTRLRASERIRDPLLVARIEAVHRVLLRARVPHVLRVRAVERVSEDELLVAYPAVRGESLVDVLRRGPLPVEQALAVLGQVCRSLAQAHAVGIEHLVLGPASIVFLRDDDPRSIAILDYGIAPLYEGCDRATDVELHPVTPERVIGGGNERAEDVYLVGCLAYWMLAGRPPFRADDLATLRRRHAIEDARRLDAFAIEGLPPHVVDAVARALEKDPDERFATIAELEAALAPAEEEDAPDEEPKAVSLPEEPRPEPAFVFAPGRRREAGVPFTVRDRSATVEVEPASLLRDTAYALRQPPMPEPVASAIAMPPQAAPKRSARRLAVTGAVALAVALASGILAFGGRAPDPEIAIEAASIVAPRVGGSEPSPAAAPVPAPEEVPLPPAPGPVAPVEPTQEDAPEEATLASSVGERTRATTIDRPVERSRPAENCALMRRAALDARSAHDWSGLLRHTTRASCWNDQGELMALRVKALMELRRFSECAELGRRVHRPEVQQWTRLCEKRAGTET